MVQRMASRAMALCFALCAAAAAFGQGLTWVSTTSGGPMGDRTSSAHMYYMPQMLRVVGNEGNRTVILRMDQQKIYTLNSNDKTYTEMTFDQLEAMAKKAASRFDANSEEMRKRLEGMPEDQRKMVEKMLAERNANKDQKAKIDVKKVGQTKQVAGYAATGYTLLRNGKEVLTLWATRDIKGYDAMKKDLRSFNQRLTSLNPMMSKEMSEALKTVEGFPLEVDMTNGVKTVMSNIESKNTPTSEFQVPSGYTKTEREAPEEEQKD